jgi:hypothetical protein
MMLGIGILAAATTLTFADRTEVRGRATSGTAAGTDESADVETDPEVRLRVRGHHDDDELQLYYTPRLILSHAAYDVCGPSSPTASCGLLPNVGSTYVTSPTPEILNGGGVTLRHQHARTAIALIEQASYGTIDAGSLLNEPAWTGTDAPPPIFPLAKYPDIQLELVTSYGGLSFYEQLSPRMDLQANASFGVYGGPDNASRATFPLTESPGLQLTLEYSLTRRDDLVFSVGADYTTVTTYVGTQPGFMPSPAAPQDVAPSSQQFSVRGYGEVRTRHRWSRDATTELGLGGVGAYQQEQPAATLPGVISVTTPYPMAEFLTTVGTAPTQPSKTVRTQLVVVGRVQPWIDIFDGTVVERAEGALGLITTAGNHTFRGEVAGHYVIPTDSSPGRYRFLYGELDYARRLGQALAIDLGVRGGAESTSEVCAASAGAATCPSAVAIPSSTGQAIYEGEMFIGFSWKPLPVKL